MKKYLAMFLTLLMMFSLASCGDTSQESSSEPSSSVPESVAEEITTEPEVTTVKTTKRRVKNTKPATTETTAEVTTEPTTEKEITLDSKFECDYLTIDKYSGWDEKVETEDDEIIVTWVANDGTLYSRIWFRIKIPSDNGKMSEEDLKEKYSEYKSIHKILDSFTKNEQAYLVYSIGGEDYIMQGVNFSTNDFEGIIEYSNEDKEIVMKMVDSIEFKENSTTSETEKPTEPPTEAPTEAPTQPPTEMPVVQKEERTVYYTETGSKYHYDSKCGRGNYFPCTLDEALAMGLEPCKKCTSGAF